jgi:putative FmdB family regulatory protein
MPLYDYLCPACGHRFEALARSSCDIPACPQCAATPERQVSAPVAPGRSKAIISAARRQAAREGHFSNFSAAEQRQLLR